MRVVRLLPLLCAFWPLFAFAQTAEFRLYTVANGLPQNGIFSIKQDAQGFIWLLHNDYLSRFDGAQFRSYANASQPIFSRHWENGAFQPLDQQLIYCSGNKIGSIDIRNGARSLLATLALPPDAFADFGHCVQLGNGAVVVVYPAEKTGNIYLYPVSQGKVGERITLQGVYAAHEIFNYTFCGDSDGNLYALSNSHENILRFDQNGQKTGVFPVNMHSSLLVRLVPGSRNAVLFSVGNTVYKLAKGASAFEPHPINPYIKTQDVSIFDLQETPQGDLWLSGGERFLFYYNAQRNSAVHYHDKVTELVQNQTILSHIMLDGSGTLWATTTMGLLKITPEIALFDTYFTEQNPACQGYCSFRGFTEDDQGNIYVGFYNNVFKIEASDKSKPPYTPLLPQENSPFDLSFYKGKLLLNKGALFDTQTKKTDYLNLEKPARAEGGVFAYDDENKQLWWEFYGKIYVLNTSSNGAPSWENVGDFNRRGVVSDMAYDRFSHKLWLCDEVSLWSFDPVSHQTNFVEAQNPDERISPKCILPDQQGKLWLGTEKGLVYLDYRTGKQRRYTRADGLANDIVVGILPEGDSCLWIATYNGLSRLSIKSGKFINFYEQNGLAGHEFNRASFFKASDGRFFFGGTKGVTAFYPQKVMEQYNLSKRGDRLLLRAVSMTCDGSDSLLVRLFHDPQQALDVYHENHTLSIEFGVFGAYDYGQTLYSYRLEGLERNWSAPSSNTAVTFSNLPAGAYVFQVKALDARGNWTSEELRLPLLVHPPWWNSWWAWLLYGLVLAAAVYGIYMALKRRWELNSRLLLEQKEAQRLKELDRFKSSLFTNLTHEFRTPLTVILGMAEQVQEGNKAKSNSAAADLIKRNAQNLLRLINQMLDLSKLEDKSFKLNLQRGNIVPFLRYVTESYQSYAQSLQLSIRFSTDMDTLETDFDPEQMQQVMGNLLSNAIKFTPAKGAIQVRLSSENQSAGTTEPASFTIQVQDTGIGIPKAELPLVFDRFYQVDGPMVRAGAGTGIGLAHAQELVHLMGGRISVESEVGKGAVFTVHFPIVNNIEPTENQYFTINPNDIKVQQIYPQIGDSAAPFLPETTAENQGADHPTLLIIEDNADVVFYLKTVLDNIYDITVAPNGRIGIETALEQIPDLIISDVMMPERDGYQVLEALKQDERSSHIPIVLLTAKVDAASKIAGLHRGADAYLPKPFDKTELLAILQMMLQNQQRKAAYFSRKYGPPQKTAALETHADQPDIQSITTESDLQTEDAFLQKVRRIVAENYADEDFSLPQLCQLIGMSRYQLFRKMKALADESPSDFIRNYRMRQANLLLRTTTHSIKEVAYMVGYKDIPHFSRTYQEVFGMPPSATNR